MRYMFWFNPRLSSTKINLLQGDHVNVRKVIDKLKYGETIVVNWSDCYTPATGWMNADEVEEFKNDLFEVISCGFFDGSKKDHICLVQSVGAPDDIFAEKKSHLKNIPIGCVNYIIRLKEDKSQTKKPKVTDNGKKKVKEV